jgi:hypothetical protein
MWKKTADYSMRIALLVSMTLYGVGPAAAAFLPRAELSGAAQDGNRIAGLMDLDTLLAAFRSEPPARQTVDHPGKPDTGSRYEGREARDGRTQEIPLSRRTTRRIVLDLESVRRECSLYEEVYRIDCLRQGIDMVASSLPDNSEYREAKRILKRASGNLGRVVSTYQDKAAPKLEVPASANPRFKKRRKYTAIKREAVPQAMARAVDIVNEATTELLRSGENSERRYVHYQDISVAVDSTKTLLRSS